MKPLLARGRRAAVHDHAIQARTTLQHSLARVERLIKVANARIREVSEQTLSLEAAARRRERDYEELSSRLLRLQDEERRRFANDLHESTAQRLAALTMNLDMIKADLHGVDANVRRRVLESRQLAAGCAEEIRTLAYLLHPPPLKTHGLPSAVRRFVEGFMERSRIHVNMQLVEVGRLPQPVETAFFRVVQESLTNIRRHASGSNAAIRLTRSASLVVLEITDSSRSVQDDPETRKDGPSATLGVGILGMEERIRQLGGTFDVAFTRHGATVRAAVPVRSLRAHPNPRR